MQNNLHKLYNIVISQFFIHDFFTFVHKHRNIHVSKVFNIK